MTKSYGTNTKVKDLELGDYIRSQKSHNKIMEVIKIDPSVYVRNIAKDKRSRLKKANDTLVLDNGDELVIKVSGVSDASGTP